MKKMKDFLKSLGTYVFLMLLLLIMGIGVIAEISPRTIPDWMYAAGQIMSIPCVVAFFTVIFKERKNQRKAKKEK